MADYKKMYAVLCGAVDSVIEDLEKIPLALPSAQALICAMECAEEIYIEISVYPIASEDEKITILKIDNDLS